MREENVFKTSNEYFEGLKKFLDMPLNLTTRVFFSVFYNSPGKEKYPNVILTYSNRVQLLKHFPPMPGNADCEAGNHPGQDTSPL